MKVFALLLSIIVLWFSTLPDTITVSQNASSCEDNCCEQNCTTKKPFDTPKSDDCCPNGVCNPFKACNCCCVIFTAAVQFQPKPMFIYAEIDYPQKTNQMISSYIAACFHPPETGIVL